MDDVKAYRIIIAVLLGLLVVFFAVNMSFKIYQWGHKDEVHLWCELVDDPSGGGSSYNKHYEGPADKVIGACDTRR